jgi:NitT/TauT family transport system ATP-binding protein
MIELRAVDKVYGVGRNAREVVRSCSFAIERNKLTVMMGPSGAGKSTLVRLTAGFERPTRGEILSDGKPVDGPGSDRLVVFQESALFPWMVTRENVLYGPKARGELTPQAQAFAEAILDKVGLSAWRARFPRELSGGMQRRAELARALVNRPALMILDEPFRGLDAMTKKLMLEYYVALFEEGGRTDFFVTTDIDEAIFLADRLLIMTHIPTRVRSVIEIDLPRPRSLSAIMRDDRASAFKMEALSLLHEEALKAFASGNRTAAEFVDAYRRRVAAG